MSADKRHQEASIWLTLQEVFAKDVNVAFDGGFDGGICAEPVVERCVPGRKDSNIGGPQIETGQLVRRQPPGLLFCDLSAAEKELARSISRVCDGVHGSYAVWKSKATDLHIR